MEDRIIELETRLSYQDDMILKLNEVIIELRGELAELTGRVEYAEQKLRALQPSAVKALDDETPPPHY